MTSRDVTLSPPVKQSYQSGLLKARRWSNPGLGLKPGPSFDVYSHYVNGVNENEAMMRDHRKQLVKTADGKGKAKDQRAAYDDVWSQVATTQRILTWSRGKFKAWKKKKENELEILGPEQGSPNALLTRKNTVSRMSGRSRDTAHRTRSRSSMSNSSDEEREPTRPPKIRTFWWYCGVIKALCKLGLDMQRLSMRKTEQTSLSELYYVSVSGSAPGEKDDGQILFFDKTLFTRKRAASRCPEWAQNLMIRKPENRKPHEVQHLKHLLNSMRSFREKYTDDMRTKMCQVVRYTRCDKGRVVLRQGHLGHYFYFIFSGSVFVQIDVYDERTEQTTPSTENIIRTGDSFGEIALLGDGMRSASVICREPTELCQIDKGTFLKICPFLFQEQLDEKMNFARDFPLFQTWEEERVKELCFLSQLMYIPHGSVIELDWSTSQFVYLVIKGRISMIKEFDITDSSTAEEEAEEKVLRDEDWQQELRRTEDEERYTILAPPPPEDSGLAQRIKSQGTTLVDNKRFACVGTLGQGQSSDLRNLSIKPVKIPKIALLSEGVKVLRVAIRNFSRYGPRRQMEEYLKKTYIPSPIPSTKALLSRYTKDVCWKTYRKRVMRTIGRERGGSAVVHMSAVSKGSTGWARWPGFDPQTKDKTGRLSAKGNKSTYEDFPLAEIPPKYCRRQKMLAARAPPPRPSLTLTSPEEVKVPITNDRTLILYPPNKMTSAFMRRSMGDAEASNSLPAVVGATHEEVQEP